MIVRWISKYPPGVRTVAKAASCDVYL